MKHSYPFVFEKDFAQDQQHIWHEQFVKAEPFNHVVIDNFLPDAHAEYLSENFPKPEHPIWLDWTKRSPNQYGKQGPGGSANFFLLEPEFRFALNEFLGSYFLEMLEGVTGIRGLIPDPYFTGGGMHQILNGGILDIHTDFNDYKRLSLYRQLNVLVYLTLDWKPEYGGNLELWDTAPRNNGKCIHSIGPIFNRAVIFKTDKTSFHGHPSEWNAPDDLTRRSLAFYYYTANPLTNQTYDELTDFQGVSEKSLPS